MVNTSAVTFESYKKNLETDGCGWVCEDANGNIIGFSILDLTHNNIWALFIQPEFEGKGIGRKLHQLMLDWSFDNGAKYLYLTTDPGTRAERFYIKAGWEIKSIQPDGGLRLEIIKIKWLHEREISTYRSC